MIRYAQGDQFLVALHQIGHTALVAKTKLPNQGNHFQAEFAMRQRPAPFFFRPVGLVKARTVGLDTLTYDQSQLPQTRKGAHRAMTVIGHPQWLTTLLTVLLERGQCFLMRRLRTRSSSRHGLSPLVLVCLLLLSGYTLCQVFFAIQRFFGCGKRCEQIVISVDMGVV